MKIKAKFVVGDLEFSSALKKTYTFEELQEKNFQFKDGWRIPTIEELKLLYNAEPSSHIYGSWFWSSSPNAYDSNSAWLLSFSYGYDVNYDRRGKYGVLLVRNRENRTYNTQLNSIKEKLELDLNSRNLNKSGDYKLAPLCFNEEAVNVSGGECYFADCKWHCKNEPLCGVIDSDVMKYNTHRNDDHCPVCGYYCLGKGGVGCINKPKLCDKEALKI